MSRAVDRQDAGLAARHLTALLPLGVDAMGHFTYLLRVVDLLGAGLARLGLMRHHAEEVDTLAEALLTHFGDLMEVGGSDRHVRYAA